MLGTPDRGGDVLDHLGRFVADLSWATIPTPARERAQLALHDTIGTILGGAVTSAARLAAQSASAYPGDIPVLGARRDDGSPVRSVAPLAAFATGVAASALDFDDGHYLGGAIHPGSVIVSTLVTAAASMQVSIRDVLVAQVAGYELALRAAHLLWPRHDGDDYHCTGTAATLGAAAAVAKLRGGDAQAISRAIAIAWAHAPMSTFQLPMVKESIGWSAATASFAADLAAAGFMSPLGSGGSTIDHILPPTPFHRPGAMSDPFVASLGEVFETAHTYFKPYAACRYTHAAARALAELMASKSLTANDIESIEVHTHRGALFLDDQRPATLDHAQYSFPFVLSAILCDGVAAQDQISETQLANPMRLTEAAKVTVHHDLALDALYPQHYASRLVVSTTGQQRLEVTRVPSPGDADDPMSADELTAKFVALAKPSLGNRATEVARILSDPAELDRFDLLELLAFSE
jgi:2-methylcitrate dehydratase PrpD